MKKQLASQAHQSFGLWYDWSLDFGQDPSSSRIHHHDGYLPLEDCALCPLEAVQYDCRVLLESTFHQPWSFVHYLSIPWGCKTKPQPPQVLHWLAVSYAPSEQHIGLTLIPLLGQEGERAFLWRPEGSPQMGCVLEVELAGHQVWDPESLQQNWKNQSNYKLWWQKMSAYITSSTTLHLLLEIPFLQGYLSSHWSQVGSLPPHPGELWELLFATNG